MEYSSFTQKELLNLFSIGKIKAELHDGCLRYYMDGVDIHDHLVENIQEARLGEYLAEQALDQIIDEVGYTSCVTLTLHRAQLTNVVFVDHCIMQCRKKRCKINFKLSGASNLISQQLYKNYEHNLSRLQRLKLIEPIGHSLALRSV